MRKVTGLLLATERRAIAGLAGLYATRMLGLFMVLPVLALYADDLAGATPLLVGLALGVYGLTQAVLQIPFGLLSDRLGRKPVIAAGLLLFLLGSVVAAQADTIGGVILGRCLQGSGAVAAAIMALLADQTREQVRTAAMATIGLSIGVAFAVAMVLGPWLSAWLGLSAVFWFTALLAVLGLAVLWKLVPPAPRRLRHRDVGLDRGQLGDTRVVHAKHVLTYGGNLRFNNFNLTIAPPKDTRTEGGAYVQDEFMMSEMFRVVAGARVDKFSSIDSAVFSPRVAVVMKPTTDQSVRASYNRAFRAPSMVNNQRNTTVATAIPLGLINAGYGSAIYQLPTTATGNLDLKEESIDAFEVAYTANIRQRATVSAAFFYTKYKDGIYFTTVETWGATTPPPRGPVRGTGSRRAASAGTGAPRGTGPTAGPRRRP